MSCRVRRPAVGIFTRACVQSIGAKKRQFNVIALFRGASTLFPGVANDNGRAALKTTVFLITRRGFQTRTRTCRFRNRWSSLGFINSRADDANVPLHRYYCAILWPRFATRRWFTLCSGRRSIVARQRRGRAREKVRGCVHYDTHYSLPRDNVRLRSSFSSE